MQIRVGNLSMMTTQQQLADLFFPFGRVISSKIQASNPKGRFGRIGLIEMSNKCGQAAIRTLHLVLFMNSYIEVDEVLG
ncbi:MAG TPA: RNA-binding protein [Puia sp.]|nr:RNA-binding protein [Puia sp.]